MGMQRKIEIKHEVFSPGTLKVKLKLTLLLLLPFQFSVLKCLCHHCKNHLVWKKQVTDWNNTPRARLPCELSSFCSILASLQFNEAHENQNGNSKVPVFSNTESENKSKNKS